MIVKKVHEIISLKQRKWLEKNINFNTRKRNQAVNDFEKDFYELRNNAFYGKTMESVQIRLKIKFTEKDDSDENNKTTNEIDFQWYS